MLDSYGAGGTSTARVHVRSKALTIGQLFNISQAKTTLALDAADGASVKQVLIATSASAPASSSEARRFLLSTTPTTSSELLYASLLRTLWLTYEITTISADDVASLIAVLEGIVAQPADIASSTASSALRFLSQVRSLSHARLNRMVYEVCVRK